MLQSVEGRSASMPPCDGALPALSVSLLKIPVSDVVRAVAFYRDVLGFEVLFVVPEYGWAQLQGGASLALALYVPGKGGGARAVGGSLDFHLHTSALEALLVRWAGAGDTVTGVVTGNDGTRFVEVTDPDGNVLKVVEEGR